MCDQQGTLGKTLKSAYLLLFFSFVRQSNIAPRSAKAYDFTRHLSIADIFFSPPGAILLIKWTKTIQYGRHVLLPIPQFTHRHCPVRALRRMMATHPQQKTGNSPLFQMPNTNCTAMSSKFLADALKVILTSLGVPNIFTLHSFRRGGATAAYEAGVDHTKIKRQGIWQSDFFWQYITTNTLDMDIPQALADQFISNDIGSD
jgi:integrase